MFIAVWYLLKLFQVWEDGEWRRMVREWIQVWYIERTFVNDTMYSQPAHQ
jgi:hypothetical protein